jgi:hydrogenase/urease accessory protein HupE
LDKGNRITVQNWKCIDELWGDSIGLRGLEYSTTDALVRIQPLIGGSLSLRLTPERAITQIPSQHDTVIHNVATTYTVLGVEHILAGLDHLFFVILMVLLISGWRRVAWTITAFTLAHSITLIGSTMNFVSLPQQPVEAVIALSIMFLASEIIQSNPNKKRISESQPWLIAFIFGLLHGFGFAGALAEIGLPNGEIPLALLCFNVGVELGQLAVVALVLLVISLFNRFAPSRLLSFKLICSYLVGITATYWFLERLGVF